MAEIDATSETLKAVLDPVLGAVFAGAIAEITTLIDPVKLAPPRVTLFLFDAQEDVSARNRPRVRVEEQGEVKLRRPDLTLQLQYLLTAWSDNQPLTEQALLAATLRTLYDGAILRGTQLKGSLAGRDVALKVTPLQLSLEDVTRVWASLHKPYRVSVIYQVRVVPLASLSETTLPPVTRRTVRYAQAGS